MASIDKTYVNKSQYLQVRQFWLDTKEQQIKELGYCTWLFPFDAFNIVHPAKITEEILNTNKDLEMYFYDDHLEFPVWNTSGIFDLWLAKNCNLDFIQSRLKEQYRSNWIGFTYNDKLDFSEKSWIVSIKDMNSVVYFFRKIDENTVETLENIIVYGTTYFMKFFNDALSNLEGLVHNSQMTITFEFYGLVIENRLGKNYIDDQEILLPHFKEIQLELPKIKHSYKLSDAKKYHDEEIFMSHDLECFDITQYKNFNRNLLKRYVSFLPEYIRKLIK